VLGAVTALVAAAITFGGGALTFGGGKQTALPVADSSAAPLMGASIPSQADLTRDTAQFGRLGIVRVYYTGLPKANAWTTGLPAANKSAVIVSFNADPGAILSGADNAVLSHFFDTAPRGHTIYYSLNHEPEEHIATGQYTAAAYRAAWAHVVALANAANNPYLRSTLILMAYDLRPASHRDWHDYLPGGGIISTLAWDAYPPGARQLTPPAQFLAPAIAASKSAGLPFGFAEFGVTDHSNRPEWLTEVGNYLMKSGALFGSLFDSTPPGRPDLTITDSASIAAWRNIVTESDILNGIGSTKPKPAPSKTPSTGLPVLASDSPVVSGLALSPAAVTVRGLDHAAVTFRVSQATDVTVLVLNGDGTVVRTLSRPAQAEGSFLIRYYGYGRAGRPLAAGSYQVVVVASNANGSGTAEAPLTINAP
jgi:hypothetical protein